jgi:hydrogenase expression/formation protein HypC
MCLGVPGKILSIDEPGQGSKERIGAVDFQGSQVCVSLAMLPEAEVGNWVLVHAGYGLTLLNEEEAAETWDWLDRAELVNEMPAAVAAKLHPVESE